MGKHSLGDASVFWRSLSLTVLRWLAIVALPVLVIFGIYKLVVKPDGEAAPLEQSSASPSAAVVPDESAAPSPAPTGLPDVQILKGAPEAEFVEAAKTKVTAAGYKVVTTGATSRRYEKTTVFYQPQFQEEADALAAILSGPETQPAPDNLDKQIPLTVVTGSDYQKG